MICIRKMFRINVWGTAVLKNVKNNKHHMEIKPRYVTVIPFRGQVKFQRPYCQTRKVSELFLEL